MCRKPFPWDERKRDGNAGAVRWRMAKLHGAVYGAASWRMRGAVPSDVVVFVRDLFISSSGRWWRLTGARAL